MPGWVSIDERPPTEKDADAQKCVMVWHELSGCLIYHIERVQKNQFITHWMRLPGKPGGARYAEGAGIAAGDQPQVH